MQIILGIALFLIAIKIVKKVTKLIFFILIAGGIYCFAKGILDVGVLMEWWSTIF
jgi:hypothetical protein